MNRFTTITRAGLTAMRAFSQSPMPTGAVVTRRWISWMAFEQPNPALYIKYPPKTDGSTKIHGSDESDVAPKTVSATAGKTTGGEKPRQEKATTSDKPNSTKDKGTATSSPDSSFLSTTLINIDGCPVTWACE